jgi:hypothetical protein
MEAMLFCGARPILRLMHVSVIDTASRRLSMQCAFRMFKDQ